MSAGHFHVHGPHDHEVEHAAHGAEHADTPGLNQRVALMTAVFAVLGAICSWQGGETLSSAMFLKNESILHKNQSVLKKTEASNQWNYYQAKSSKQNLAELALALSPREKQQFYHDEIERYKKEKGDIQKEAQKLEEEVKKFDKLSEEANGRSAELIHPHHRWEQGTTWFNVAIALSAITIVTRRSWLFWGSLSFGALGAVFGAMALAHL